MLDDLEVPPGQRRKHKDSIAQCFKEVWELYISVQDAENQAVSNASDNDDHSVVVPDFLSNSHALNENRWSDMDVIQQRSVHTIANGFQDIFQSNRFFSAQVPGAQELGPQMPTYGRPSTPQRENSFWSDSGVGTSSACDQCGDGSCDRCRSTVKLSVWTPYQDMYSGFPATSQHQMNDASFPGMSQGYDSSPIPQADSFTIGNTQQFEDFQFQNYCGRSEHL